MESEEILITELDEEGVVNLLNSLGFPFYEAQIKEHGITGDILIHLDHEALKDVGIHSLGQRLTILQEVYRLKVLQNIPIEQGHYVPPPDEMEKYFGEERSHGYITAQQVLDMLSERDDRISNLEMEVQRLQMSIISLREESLPPRPNSKTSVRPAIRSPTNTLFPHPLSNSATLNSNSRNLEPISNLPDSPRSPMDSPRLNESSTGNRGERILLGTNGTTGDYNGTGFSASSLSPTILSDGVISASASALGGGGGRHHDEISPPTGSTFSTNTSPLHTSTLNTISLPIPNFSSTTLANEKAGVDTLQRSATSANSSDNPYRSFRVTLDDPCYKVLPAALKKYKIIDDWRQYALFICYGNTERCLSYDEKPLLLFQKLKDGNANPVFMLRHIKDIKSPITVATSKHLLRKDKRSPNAGLGLDKPPVLARDGTVLIRNNRLHYPPVLLPVGKDKDKFEGGGPGGESEVNEPAEGNASGMNSRLPLPAPPGSPREATGYCISIYPYLAERDDEFDVSVGDTFIIISKTKGWWVVYRDLGPSHPLDTSTRRSAWVPAGCLLETSIPPLSLASASGLDSNLTSAANIPISPNFVVSVSTPGLALMDYVKNGSDQLDVKKGTQLRILKRYNHWSYAIKEDGTRGWIPSWFCGRSPSRGDTPTTPTISASRIAGGGGRSTGEEE